MNFIFHKTVILLAGIHRRRDLNLSVAQSFFFITVSVFKSKRQNEDNKKTTKQILYECIYAEYGKTSV